LVLGSRGTFGSPLQGQGKERQYVNAANGNLTIQDRDDLIVGQNDINLALNRSYNAQGNLNDRLGSQWQLGSRRQITLSGLRNGVGSKITRINEDGSASLFKYDSTRVAYISTDGAGAYQSIVYDENKGFIWHGEQFAQHGEFEVYSANNGRLLSVGDESGVLQNFGYDDTGKLVRIATGAGDQVFFEYTANGNLAQIRTQATGDTSGGQVRVRYRYDNLNRLEQVITDLSPERAGIEDGNTYRVKYTYDGSSNRIGSITQSDGTTVGFAYIQVKGEWRVKSVLDGRGGLTQFVWSADLKSTSVTDPLGFTTTFGYDDLGQLSYVAAPIVNGKRQVNSYFYDAQGNLVRAVDAQGLETVYEYDGNGNRVLERDAAGNTLTRLYDKSNHLLSETRYVTPDPDGGGQQQPGIPLTTHYAYDNKNHLRFAISADGRVQEYRYNSLGQNIALISYAGNRYLGQGFTSSDLDAWVASASVDKTLISRTDYRFDARGQLAGSTTFASVDANGTGIVNPDLDVRIQYVYDQAGQLLKAIDSNGNQTAWAYDSLGRVLATQSLSPTGSVLRTTTTTWQDAQSRTLGTAANGLGTLITADANGQILSISEQDSIARNLGTTRNHYDAAGRLRQIEGQNGQSQFFVYNAAGRKIADLDSDGSLTEYLYNADDQIIKTIRYATLARISLLADAQGNPLEVEIGNLRPAANKADQVSFNFYDSANQLSDTVDASGAVTRYRYDGLGRIVTQTRFANRINLDALAGKTSVGTLASSAQDRITRNFYDSDSNLVGVLDADGYLTENSWDGANRLVQSVRYSTATNPGLRANGNLASLRPLSQAANDVITRQIYNSENRLIGSIDAENYLTEIRYDAVGNITARIRYAKPVGNPAAATLAGLGIKFDKEDQTSSFTYNALNQLVTERASDATLTRHLYDSVGNEIDVRRGLASNDERATQTRYDVQGNVLAKLSAEGVALLDKAASASDIAAIWDRYALRYSYDQNGLRTSLTDQNGYRTLYYYDADGHLTHTINALGEVSEQHYDGLNQVDTRTRYAKRIDSNTLSQLTGGQFNVGLNKIVTALRSVADRIERQTYDKLGRLLDQVDATGFHTIYQYNAFGNLLESARQSSEDPNRYIATDYGYDNRGNLTRTIPLNNPAYTDTVEYDAFGRAIRHVDARGNARISNFDRLGRVIAIKDPLTPAALTTYDAFDRVLSQTDPQGNTTRYSYDTAQRTFTVTTPEGLVHVTQKNQFGETVSISSNGNDFTRYRYDKNGSLIQVEDGAGIQSTALFDAAGLILSSTDSNGKVTTFAYDAASRIVSKVFDPASVANPGGLNLRTAWTYTGFGQTLRQTDARGVVTETDYDKAGRVARITVDPAGLNLITRFEYDSRGNQIGVYDPNGNLTQYRISETDQQNSSVLDPGGANLTTHLIRDAVGNVILRSSGANHSASSRYAYDANNRLIWEIDPEGQVTGYSYDDNNRLIQTTRYANSSSLVKSAAIWSSVFSASEIAQSVQPDAVRDITSRILYDKDGRVSAKIDGAGTVTAYLAYDTENRVLEQITYAKALDQPPIPGRLSPQQWQTLFAPLRDAVHDQHRYFRYDARGRTTAIITQTGLVTGKANWAVLTQTFDGNGNITSRTSYAKPLQSDTPLADLQNWLNSNPASANDARQILRWDAANRLIASANVLRPGSNGVGQFEWAVSTREYDANGNVILQRNYVKPLVAAVPDAQALTAFSVDPANANAPGNGQTRQLYDNANRIVAVAVAQTLADDGGLLWTVTQRKYDQGGNLLEQRVLANPLNSNTLSAKPGVTEYTNWIRSAVPDGTRDQISRFAFDTANRLVLQVDAAGGVIRNRYDALGNLVQQIRYATPLAAEKTVSAATVIIADPANDRVSRTIFDLDQRPVYEIDALGNVTGHRYNALGQEVAIVRFAVALGGTGLNNESSPADVSRLLQTDAARDRTERSVFDQQGRKIFSLDALAYLKQYQYDALGHLLAVREFARPVEQADSNLVNALDKFALDNANSDDTRLTRYRYDAQGHVLSSTDALGSTESWSYNALGQKTAFTNKLGVVWRYEYDAAGNLISELAPSVTVHTPVFDVNGKLRNLSQSFEAGLRTRFEYNALGQLSSRTEGLADRLVNGQPVTDSSNARTTRYEYDAVGRQIKTIFPPVGVYNASENPGANGVAGDASRSDTEQTLSSQVRYDALGNALANTDVGKRNSYKAYDLLGRVRYAIDAEGYVTGYQYNTFGQVTRLTRYASKTAISESDVRQAARIDALLAAYPHDQDRVLTTEYDRNGRSTRVIEGATFSFDTANAANDYQTVARTTQSAYNGFGEIIKQSVYGANAAGLALTQSQDTYYYYNQRGFQHAQISVSRRENGQAYGYLTTSSADQAGNIISQTEYAQEIALSNSAQNGLIYDSPVIDVARDRKTSFIYDKTNQKVTETRHNQTYATNGGTNGVNAVNGNLVTRYGYDALGNLVSRIDALGNATFTYYDVLGRTRATVQAWLTPDGVSRQLSEFKLDVYGNTVLRIDYAGKIATADAKGYAPALPDTQNDRINTNQYDKSGHALQNLDAEGNASYNSYDAYGHLAKQWQTVSSNLYGTTHKETIFSVTRYDGLGRVIEVIKPDVHSALTEATSTAKTLARQIIEYNAFGELTARRISDSANNRSVQGILYAYNDYDNAGHLWRSNEGDGIDKVTLFDAFGNATAQLRSVDHTLRDVANAAASLQLNDVLRTNTRYDLQNRAIDVGRTIDTRPTFLVRDANSNWNAISAPTLLTDLQGNPIRDGNGNFQTSNQSKAVLDPLLVIGEVSDFDKKFSVRLRRQGSTEWQAGADESITRIGDYVVFRTAGLNAGNYEYQISLQPGSQPAYERERGILQIATASSNAKQLQVAALYSVILGRAVDGSGLARWTPVLNQGSSLATLAGNLLDAPEAKARLGGSATDTIRKILRDAFGRAADPALEADVAAWASAYSINRGQAIADLIDFVSNYSGTDPVWQKAQAILQNRTNVLTDYLNAGGDDLVDEAQLYGSAATNLAAAKADATQRAAAFVRKTQIAAAYLAILGRAPEKAGFDERANSTLAAEAIAAALLDSDQAKAAALFPTADANGKPLTGAQLRQQLIRRTFLNLLGREPDSQELNDWNTRLTVGIPVTNSGPAQAPLGNAGFVLQLTNSIANYHGSDAGKNNDKQRLNDKISVALAYAALPQSDPARAILSARLLNNAVNAQADVLTSLDLARSSLANARTDGLIATLASGTARDSTQVEQARLNVARLFIALQARLPVRSEIDYYASVLQNNSRSLADIANTLLNNNEAKERGLYPLAQSNTAFISDIYQRISGNVPDVNFLANWVPKVGSNNRAAVAVELINALGEGGINGFASSALFNNRVALGVIYAVDLGGEDRAAASTLYQRTDAGDISIAIAAASSAVFGAAQSAATNIAQSTDEALRLSSTNLQAAIDLSAAQTVLNTASSAVAGNSRADAAVHVARLLAGLAKRSTIGLSELNVWINASLAGQSDAKIAQNLFDSPQGQALFAPLSFTPAGFVNQVWQQLFGRAATSSETATWSNGLTSASQRGQVFVNILNHFLQNGDLKSRADFLANVATLIGSANATAAQSNAADALEKARALETANAALAATSGNAPYASQARDLARLYVAIQNRGAGRAGGPIDIAQFIDHLSTLANGGNLIVLAESLLQSSQGRAQLPATLSAHDFVAKLHQQILGQPLAGNNTTWENQLASGKLSRASLVLALIDNLANHSALNLGEQTSKAEFEARTKVVLDQIGPALLNLTETARAAFNNAQAQADASAKAKKLAQTGLNEASTTKDRADAAIVPAQSNYDAAKLYQTAKSRDALIELLQAFGAATDINSIKGDLADLEAGRTTLAAIANRIAGNAPAKGGIFGFAKRILYFEKLFSSVLKRAYDGNRPTERAALTQWLNNPAATAWDFFVFAKNTELYSNTSRRAFAAELATTGKNIRAQADAAIQAYGEAGTALNAAKQKLTEASSTYAKAASEDQAAALARDTAKAVFDRVNLVNTAAGGATQAVAASVLAGNATLAALNARSLVERDRGGAGIALGSAVLQTVSDETTQLAGALNADITLLKSQSNVLRANFALTDSLQKAAAASDATKLPIQLIRLYRTVFGNAPTVLQLDAAVRKLNSGTSQIALVGSLLEISGNYPLGSSNTDFVNQLFQQGLKRAPDDAGKAYWLGLLNGKPPTPRENLILAFVNSLNQPGTHADLITVQQTDKEAESALLASVRSIKNAPDLTTLIRPVIDSERAIALSGDGTSGSGSAVQNSLLATRLFVAVLNRAPALDLASDVPTFNDVFSALTQGRSAAQLAQQLIESREGKKLFPSGQTPTELIRSLSLQIRGFVPSEAETREQLAILQNPANAANAKGALILNILDGTVNYSGYDPARQFAHTRFDAQVNLALRRVVPDSQKYSDALSNAINIINTLTSGSGEARIHAYLGTPDKGVDTALIGGQKFAPSANLLTLDRWGNVLSVSDPRNPGWKTTYTYNANNQQTSITRPHFVDDNGRVTSSDISEYFYDALGRSLASKDGNNHVNSVVYGTAGKVVEERHADGGVVKSVYNLFGDRISVIQPPGQNGAVQTNYAYDRLGHLKSTATGAAVDVYDTSNPAGVQYQGLRILTTRFAYDELGRRVSTTDANNNTSYQQYDLDNNLIRSTSALGYVGRYSSTSAFDSFHHQISQTDATGKSDLWTVSSTGQIRSHRDQGGAEINYSYDNAGQQIEQSTHRSGYADSKIKQTWLNGLLTRIDDSGSGQVTSYTYDLANNRTREKIVVSANGGRAVNIAQRSTIRLADNSIQYLGANNLLQDNIIKYDAQNRAIEIRDGATAALSSGVYHIGYEYDGNGNRIRARTEFDNVDANTGKITGHVVQDAYNTFDEMDREVIVNGEKNANGNIVYGSFGHRLEYDKAGNRISDTFLGTRLSEVVFSRKKSNILSSIAFHIKHPYSIGNLAGSPTRQQVLRSLELTANAETRETFKYDQAGRLIETSKDNLLITDSKHYDALGRVAESGIINNGQAYEKYIGKIIPKLNLDATKKIFSYDADGRTSRQRILDTGGNLLADTNFIVNGASGYDRAGNLLNFTIYRPGRYFENHTLSYAFFDSAKETSHTIVGFNQTTSEYDINGNRIGIKENGSKRATLWYNQGGQVLYRDGGATDRQYSLIANNEALGVEDRKANTFLDNSFIGVNSAAASATPGTYVVQRNGETLQSVAQAIWGDSKLWYLLADANGLENADSLDAGDILIVPPRSTTVHNTADTLRPYNLADALGNTDPTTPAPPPQPHKKHGCGGFGQIFAVIVAVVVTAFVAVTAPELLASTVPSLFATATATANTAAFVVGGALSSIAGQAVGIATGVQDGFSWRAVATAAISSGVAAGFKSGLGATEDLLKLTGRAIASNALTQGIGVVTGLQSSFSWRAVVTAGVQPLLNQAFAPLAGAVGSNFGAGDVSKAGSLAEFANNVTQGFASGETINLLTGGKQTFASIATDVFGNAIGNSIVAKYNAPSEQENSERELLENARKSEFGSESQAKKKHDDYIEMLREQKNLSEHDIAQISAITASPEIYVRDLPPPGTPEIKSVYGERVDRTLQYLGRVAKDLSKTLEENPLLGYILKGVEVVAGPEIYLAKKAVTELTPLGGEIEDFKKKAVDTVTGKMRAAGYSDEDSDNGGIGALFALELTSSTAAGALKKITGIDSQLARLTNRHEGRKFEKLDSALNNSIGEDIAKTVAPTKNNIVINEVTQLNSNGILQKLDFQNLKRIVKEETIQYDKRGFNVKTEGELLELYNRFTYGATPHTLNEYDGAAKILADKTIIGLRNKSTTGGKTIDIIPAQGKQIKIHIKPEE
jgi:YD repeat-containing protein